MVHALLCVDVLVTKFYGTFLIISVQVSEIANAFYQSLTMSDEERLRRLSCASEFVTRVTTQRWALAVMLDLKGVYKSASPVQFSGAGLGLGFRLLGMDSGFSSLSIERVAKVFRKARARLILLDYGGTIVDNDNVRLHTYSGYLSGISSANTYSFHFNVQLDDLKRFEMVKKSRAPSVPTQHVMSLITALAADRRNTVFVVSGKETLRHRHFGPYSEPWFGC